MRLPPDQCDVAIIGAGPIGLEMAVALRSSGLEIAHFEAGAIGATMAWWAPATRFFSSPERIEIAGVPLTTVDQSKATREQYLAYLRGVVQQFDLEIHTYRRVTQIDRTGDRFALTSRPSRHGVGGPEEEARIRTGDSPAASGPDRVTRASRIVLAHGDMHRPRRLDISGEDRPHVRHFLDEPHGHFGRRVLIVGGKNSAVEAALRLYRCGAHVTISYRGDVLDPKRVKYWLRPEIEWLIGKGRIGWHPRTAPVEIHEDSVTLAPATGGEGNAIEIPADAVLLLIGYVQDPELFEQLGLDLVGPERAPAHDPETMECSVPGVFIAGTAAGGSQQRAHLFIENSHVHVERIAAAIKGDAASGAVDEDYAALEEN